MTKRPSGQILLDKLLVAAIAAMVVTAGSQLVFVGLVSNKIAGDKNVALGLVEETFVAVRAVSTENWNDIDSLTHGSNHYYPEQSGGKWILTAGSEDVILNGLAYNRSLTLQNICRDLSTKAITGITDSGGSTTACIGLPGSGFDASTQKISVSISWTDADPLTEIEYLTRWRNKVCLQTNWSSSDNVVSTCPATTYDSKTNITSGTSLQLCPGGC